MKKAMAFAAVLAAGACMAWGQAAVQGQDAETQAGYRRAVRRAFASATAGLEKAPIPEGVPVAVLPVKDDPDGWLAGLAQDALIAAGKNCVVGKDDPMWDTIIEEIEWDERKSDILDPATIDRFSRLQSARVLVTASVEAYPRTERAWNAEVTMRAVEIETKRYLWSGTFARSPQAFPPDLVTETKIPLNVGVAVKCVVGAERVADGVDTWVQGRLADMGYRLETGKDDDLSLELEVEASQYDLTGEWETWKGELKATLLAQGAEPRLLGKADFPAKGKPGIGPAGERNLAYEMEEQLGAWLKRTLDPDAIGFAATKLSFTLAGPLESGEDFAVLEELRSSIAGMAGVRSVKLAAQDNEAGTVAYRTVYETEAFPGGLPNAVWAAFPELLDEILE